MANKIPNPDHRMQVIDPETGKMTTEFFIVWAAVIAALNALIP